MDAIIDRLEAALGEFVAGAMAGFTPLQVTPTLLIQPPASRAVQAERLDVLAERLGAAYSGIRSVCDRLESVKSKWETIGAQIFRQQCRCTSAQSPVSSLPPELLLKVFAAAQSDDPFVARTIARVSSQWRNVAMQERSLWRRIHIPADQLSIIQSPRSLTPFIRDPIHAVFAPQAQPMAPAVGSTLLRQLVTANIQTSDGPAVLDRIMSCADSEDASFRALEELQFEMEVDGHLFPWPPCLQSARAPILRTLTLTRCLLKMTQATSITDLTVASVQTQCQHFVAMLHHCPRLVSLRIENATLIGGVIPLRADLSELRSLEINREQVPYAGVILAHIAAPALRSFIMRDAAVPGPSVFDFEHGIHTERALIFEEFRFLVASSPELETLELRSNHSGLNQFIKMLLPHRDGLLDPESGTCPLPRLSTLNISFQPRHHWNDIPGLESRISIMLQKRVGQFGPLRKLTISECMAAHMNIDTDGMAEAVVVEHCPPFMARPWPSL